MLLPIKAFSYMFKFRFRSLAIFFSKILDSVLLKINTETSGFIPYLNYLPLMSFQSWTEGLKTSAQPRFVWFCFVFVFKMYFLVLSVSIWKYSALSSPSQHQEVKRCVKRSITINIIY